MERNTASRFCGTRFSGSPEDTQILAEVVKEKPGHQDLLGPGTQWAGPWELPDPLRAHDPEADLANVKAPTVCQHPL